MSRVLIVWMLFLVCVSARADEPPSLTYQKWVDAQGNISLPKNFRSEWAFLGTWSIAESDVEQSSAASRHGAAGLHNVYTQPEVVKYFRANRKFPDGAVLIKELLKAKTAPMTTGTVSRGDEVEGWFVMIKDREGRFDAHPLWGDGWGWALFKAENPDSTVTQNYKTECVGCHIPAKGDDWIYLSGYPVLNE